MICPSADEWIARDKPWMDCHIFLRTDGVSFDMAGPGEKMFYRVYRCDCGKEVAFPNTEKREKI